MNNSYIQKIINNEINSIELSDSDSDSDSDFDSDNKVKYKTDNIKIHTNILDKLELQYFPEPYNSLGQFIISSVVGALTTYIMKSRLNNLKNQLEYHTFLDIYYKYCSNTSNDIYINELFLKLKLDLSSDQEEILKILNKSNIFAKELMDELLDKDEIIINKYIKMPENEFSIESFNTNIMQNIISLIKFSKLSEIL